MSSGDFDYPPPDYPAPPPPIVWEPFEPANSAEEENIKKESEWVMRLKDKQIVPVWVRIVEPMRLLFFSPPYPCNASCLQGILISYLSSQSEEISTKAFFYLEFPDGTLFYRILFD